MASNQHGHTVNLKQSTRWCIYPLEAPRAPGYRCAEMATATAKVLLYPGRDCLPLGEMRCGISRWGGF